MLKSDWALSGYPIFSPDFCDETSEERLIWPLRYSSDLDMFAGTFSTLPFQKENQTPVLLGV